MRQWLPVLCAAVLWAGPSHAQGLLVPTDAGVPPLALVKHQVDVKIVEQVSVTSVTQVFRNDTDRALEATYVFPVPKGASVDKFSMWINGNEEKGELVEADKARQIYTDIVRRTQDPGLLEYIGNNLLKVRVYPVAARGEQKLAVRFTAVAESDSRLIEYVYPLRGSEKNAKMLEKFSLHATLESKHSLQNVYSPTHPITVKHEGDRKVVVSFEKEKAALDKDFQLYYTLGDKDVGLTAMAHRPDADADGHVMLLLSPRAELSKEHAIPRDMVFVLDTSGSMAGVKMDQARKALKFCLSQLKPHDRFGVINFASTVTKYDEKLHAVNPGEVAKAKKWVDELEATGGTAIDAALGAALDFRSGDEGRTFTVVFFTDGMPTVGETNPETILKTVAARNTANTRIFTFGVGDDVNAAMLDRLAEQTKAVSTYVRPEEDIEVKVSALYAKISHPVLTDLKLAVGNDVKLTEMYPNHLPDLFHGNQLVVLARYKGQGHAVVTLTGKVGEQTREFVYEVEFPGHTKNDKAFVECLWARRKVGYLLDQIRQNGEQQELVQEVVKLAKKHGITTPYTSYLVVPDGAQPPVANNQPAMPAGPYPPPQGYYINNTTINNSTVPQLATYPSGGMAGGNVQYAPSFAGPAAMPPAPAAAPLPVDRALGTTVLGANAVAAASKSPAGEMPKEHHRRTLNEADDEGAAREGEEESDAQAMTEARQAMANGQQGAQTGKLGVDYALKLQALRSQDRLSKSLTRQAAGRTCVAIRGAWIDQDFDAKMTLVKVKAMSAAYFRLLEKHPELKEVFQLGNRVVWVTPSGAALVISAEGEEKMDDDAIDRLFVAKK